MSPASAPFITPGKTCQSCVPNLPMLAKRLLAIAKILSGLSLLLVAVLPNRVQAFDIELNSPPDLVLESMIGQMIMVGFSGYRVTDSGVIGARDQLADGMIGGVVLYPENIGSPDQLRALTTFLRDARSTPVPFIAVDQEGGLVARLTRSNGHLYIPSAWSVGRNPSFSNPDTAMRLYAGMSKDLAKPASISISDPWSISISIRPTR
jgi:hypothetical protein